jgi:hypothetical protein
MILVCTENSLHLKAQHVQKPFYHILIGNNIYRAVFRKTKRLQERVNFTFYQTANGEPG